MLYIGIELRHLSIKTIFPPHDKYLYCHIADFFLIFPLTPVKYATLIMLLLMGIPKEIRELIIWATSTDLVVLCLYDNDLHCSYS